MLKRPILLIVCSMLFLYFPFEFGWDLGRGKEWSAVNLFMNVATPGLLLFGLVRVSKAAWYTLITLIGLWGIRDLALYYQQNHSSTSALVLHVFIYAISLAYFINPRVRRLYFDPKLRWWRTKPRYETHVPMMFTHKNSSQYRVLRNISEGGCFIATDATLSLNEKFEICLPMPVPLSLSVLKSVGEVRWVSTQHDKTGMGVLFVDIDRKTQKTLKEFVKNQL